MWLSAPFFLRLQKQLYLQNSIAKILITIHGMKCHSEWQNRAFKNISIHTTNPNLLSPPIGCTVLPIVLTNTSAEAAVK